MSSLVLGESVVKCQPFVCALKANQKAIRCDFCFKSISETIDCNICHKYCYCSDFCLNKDLITHRFECDSEYDLKQFIADKCRAPAVRDASDWCKFRDLDELITQTLLLLRILFKLKSDPNCATNQYSLPNGLSISYDDIKAPKCQQMHRVWDEEEEEENDSLKVELIDEVTYSFGAWLSVVKQILESDFIKSKLGPISEEVLMRAFRIVVRYTLYVCDTTFLNEIGKAIYVEMCFVSHSCVPNCGPLFDGTNLLDLRMLNSTVTEFCHLRYDYQIEMTGFSAQELADSLYIRNIECKCKKCLKPKHYSMNFHKMLTNANLKYGNWPTHDYYQAMAEPVDETLENFIKIYGKFHPWITALLLWKLRIEMVLFQESNDSTNEQLIDTFKRLKESVSITHGLHHNWFIKLSSIEKFIDTINNSSDYSNVINTAIEQIIPQIIIAQKLA